MARTKQTARKSTGAKAPRKTHPSQRPQNTNDDQIELYEFPSSLTFEQEELFELENSFRNLFAENPDDSALNDMFVLLQSVYDNVNAFYFAEEDDEEAAQPKLLCQDRPVGLKGLSVVEKNVFMVNFEELTQGCFSGMDWNNVFLAGGAVLGCVSSLDRDKSKSSDLDLFLYGLKSDEEADAKLSEIYNLVVRNTGGSGDIIRTSNAVTIIGSYPYRHVQVICRLYKSPAEVLLGFDIDSCCVGYDGENVYCMERFRRSITKRYNLVNSSRRSATYESRLYKYSKRGFAVSVPTLDKNRISPEIFQQKNLKNSSGLVKLVLYDYREINGRLNSFPRKRVDTEEEGSDYNDDVVIPWGPGLSNNVVLDLVKTKDKSRFFSSLHKRKTAKLTGNDPSTASNYKPVFIGNVHDSLGSWKRGLDGREVNNKIEWVKTSPAYQDMDNGYRRLMTGSFNPIYEQPWDEGLYSDFPSNNISFVLSRNTHNENNRPISNNRYNIKAPRKVISHNKQPRGDALPVLLQNQNTSTSGFGGSTGFNTNPGFGSEFGASNSSSGFGTSPNSTGFGTSNSNSGFGTSNSTFGSNSGFGQGSSSGFGQGNNEQTSFGFSPVSNSNSGFGTSDSSSGFGTSPNSTGFGTSSFGQGGNSGFSSLSNASPLGNQTGTKRRKVEPSPTPTSSAYPLPPEVYQHIDQSSSTFGQNDASDFGPQPTLSGVQAIPVMDFQSQQARVLQMLIQQQSYQQMDHQSQQAQVLQMLNSQQSQSPQMPHLYAIPQTHQQGNMIGFSPIPPPSKFPQEEMPRPDFSGQQPSGYSGFTGFSPMPNPERRYDIPESPSKFGPQPGGFTNTTNIQPIHTTAPRQNTQNIDIPQLHTDARTSTKLLLLVSLAYRQSQISTDEKSKFKDMIITEEPLVYSALEVFEIDHDLDEFIDTIRRICLLK